MQIALDKSILCDGTIDNGAGDYEEDEASVIETVVPARSEKARLRNRGGKRCTISFNVEREFASVLDAQRFWERHKREIPRFGTLTKTCTGDGSEGAQESVYAKAAIESMGVKFFGVTCTISYKIIAEPPVQKISEI